MHFSLIFFLNTSGTESIFAVISLQTLHILLDFSCLSHVSAQTVLRSPTLSYTSPSPSSTEPKQSKHPCFNIPDPLQIEFCSQEKKKKTYEGAVCVLPPVLPYLSSFLPSQQIKLASFPHLCHAFRNLSVFKHLIILLLYELLESSSPLTDFAVFCLVLSMLRWQESDTSTSIHEQIHVKGLLCLTTWRVITCQVSHIFPKWIRL